MGLEPVNGRYIGNTAEQQFAIGNSCNIPAAEVQVQLERLLRSEGFSRTERPGRFLTFLVEHALRGEAAKVTEYALAVEVFNRKSSFDPASDPIVRVEAGRLRRRLHEYYETQGCHDPVRIEIPPRTYVPVFCRRVPEAPVGKPAGDVRARRMWQWTTLAVLLAVAVLGGWSFSRGSGETPVLAKSGGRPGHYPPSIAVLPFVDLSPARDQEQFCDALTRSITGAVTRIARLQVVSHAWVLQYKGSRQDVRSIAAQLNAGLVLEGAVQRVGNRARITAELTNASTGYCVWSQTYDREVTDLLSVQQELAHAVLDAVRPELSRIR